MICLFFSSQVSDYLATGPSIVCLFIVFRYFLSVIASWGRFRRFSLLRRASCRISAGLLKALIMIE